MGLICGCGQQSFTIPPASSSHIRIKGVVDDWSTHHLKFSNPGTEADAIRNGTHDKWLRITNNPRYQMQQLKRSAAWQNRFRPATSFTPAMHRDWPFQIDQGNSNVYENGAFPAKYTFDINAIPSCSDFVVFPVRESGSATQANIIGLNNLYDGTCPTSSGTGQPFAPTLKFAYHVDAGSIPGSPVLSEDGTKVAFVTYTPYNTTFHVVTPGTTGNNGTAYNSPVTPCTVNGVQSCSTNNAVDSSVTLSPPNDVDSFPIASPFVDYTGDIAYFGDVGGGLHKITGVFRGTPTEVTTGGWPFRVGDTLSMPIYDSVSRHIFVTGYEGNLYCIDVSSGTPALCSPNSKVSIARVATVWDGPTVDSTAGTVFAEGTSDTGLLSPPPLLTQTTTSLGNVVQAFMGNGGAGNADLFSGDFDNSYYSGNYASGYMYFCGSSSVDEAVLYRIGFNSSGTMNSANDGNSYRLSNGSGCTPLTEAYNTGQGKDYLFLGVNNYSVTPGCAGQGCIMSFVLGSEFPSAPASSLPLGLFYATASGIVVDNVSTEAGASQIYFTNYLTGNGTQASQNGLD